MEVKFQAMKDSKLRNGYLVVFYKLNST